MRQLLAPFFILTACSSGPTPGPHVPGDCNPLGGDACMLPYPSSYFQVDDPTSATGVRNAVPHDAMPKNITHRPIDTTQLNRLDGFSPATPLILYFPSGIDLSGWATLHDFSPSLKDDAPLRIFDMSSGDRVDYFAELDANATPPMNRQALLIHPQTHLKPGTKYAVAVTGTDAPAAFVEARDNKLMPDSKLWTMKPRYDALFSFLEKHGVTRGSLSLAWDFTTASDDMITGRMVRMRDRALAAATFNYQVATVTDTPDAGHVLREVMGTFEVPSFLDSADSTSAFPADAGSDPAIVSTQSFPFIVQIPACAAAATGPLPIMLFGHGLLGTGADEVTSGYEEQAADRYCMVQVATDWIGLSFNDVDALSGTVVEDLGRFDITSHHLMQAQVNHVVLARLIKTKLKDDPALKLNGVAVSDGSELYYEGISLGAIEGGTFMALTPDIERGVTNVAGSTWSFMITRSADFNNFKSLLDIYLPDPLDQEVALAYTQSLWDETDPISYASHVLHDPLPGVTAKRLLVQESIGDAQVPNLATRILVRTQGQTALAPVVVDVPGVMSANAPLDSAYVQFDTHPMPLPGDTNTLPQDNGAHEDCRRLDVAMNQIQAFLKPNGSVQQFCDGGCDPN